MLEKGDSVPDFEVQNQKEQIVRSEAIRNAVIYFYPKADTPGCTKEACNFRDNIGLLDQAEMGIYGVSTDTVEDQRAFHEEYDLNFELLADEEGEVAEMFGVLQESGHAERTTFIIRDGEVEKVFRKVDPNEHISEVIEYLEKEIEN